ncbi:hypothetical protein BB561_001333 [Smittium simulii]|uniref:Palmitoyl-protein thioesterase 1 n=1 Tax=Smittium simulii TaxID=133385 RepID=A0A2T9YV43_9FUNG|nr:hypothetical protein BB561_001333 [Smittium simulii]
MWHGMGDDCCSGLDGVKDAIIKQIPGVYVHSIMLGKNKMQDLQQVFEKLSNDPNLSDGFYGLGFSQGGLFLRALHQRYPSLNIKRLVTIGSPHRGVASVPVCKSQNFMCNAVAKTLDYMVYTSIVQHRVVQAQYFNDPKKYNDYLKYNTFLPDINNENKINQTYIDQIKKLEKLVFVKFLRDTMVDPPDSEWFGFYNENKTIVPLVNSNIYTEDRLGLKAMDMEKKIDFVEINADHLQASDDIMDFLIQKYLMD